MNRFKKGLGLLILALPLSGLANTAVFFSGIDAFKKNKMVCSNFAIASTSPGIPNIKDGTPLTLSSGDGVPTAYYVTYYDNKKETCPPASAAACQFKILEWTSGFWNSNHHRCIAAKGNCTVTTHGSDDSEFDLHLNQTGNQITYAGHSGCENLFSKK